MEVEVTCVRENKTADPGITDPRFTEVLPGYTARVYSAESIKGDPERYIQILADLLHIEFRDAWSNDPGKGKIYGEGYISNTMLAQLGKMGYSCNIYDPPSGSKLTQEDLQSLMIQYALDVDAIEAKGIISAIWTPVSTKEYIRKALIANEGGLILFTDNEDKLAAWVMYYKQDDLREKLMNEARGRALEDMRVFSLQPDIYELLNSLPILKKSWLNVMMGKLSDNDVNLILKHIPQSHPMLVGMISAITGNIKIATGVETDTGEQYEIQLRDLPPNIPYTYLDTMGLSSTYRNQRGKRLERLKLLQHIGKMTTTLFEEGATGAHSNGVALTRSNIKDDGVQKLLAAAGFNNNYYLLSEADPERVFTARLPKEILTGCISLAKHRVGEPNNQFKSISDHTLLYVRRIIIDAALHQMFLCKANDEVRELFLAAAKGTRNQNLETLLGESVRKTIGYTTFSLSFNYLLYYPLLLKGLMDGNSNIYSALTLFELTPVGMSGIARALITGLELDTPKSLSATFNDDKMSLQNKINNAFKVLLPSLISGIDMGYMLTAPLIPLLKNATYMDMIADYLEHKRRILIGPEPRFNTMSRLLRKIANQYITNYKGLII